MINLSIDLNKNVIFNEYLDRRSKKEPIAYILEEKEFWSKKFYISRITLIPRPETELLVDRLIKIYEKKSITILDIGTGSGCIILSLLSELKNSTGVALMFNKVIKVAEKNAAKLKLSDKIKFFNKSFEVILIKNLI